MLSDFKKHPTNPGVFYKIVPGISDQPQNILKKFQKTFPKSQCRFTFTYYLMPNAIEQLRSYYFFRTKILNRTFEKADFLFRILNPTFDKVDLLFRDRFLDYLLGLAYVKKALYEFST